MFDLETESPINKGKLHSLIVDFIGKTADIQYEVGYEHDGFQSIGVDKLFLQDCEEEKDNEGNVIKEASTDFTEFYEKLNHEADPKEVCLQTLQDKDIKKKRKV